MYGSKRLTREEVAATMAGLSANIERYAELLVRKGAAIAPGQELVLTAPVERADFARMVVREAYAAGAANVTVVWSDDEIRRMDYDYHDVEFYEQVPAWKRAQLNDLAEAGAAFLFLEGSDPNGLAGVDPAKIATASRARNTQCKRFRDGLDFGRNAWCIAGVPVTAWARMVFPGRDDDEAMLRLWQAILQTARADGPAPQQEWERHNATFEKNKRILNDYTFDHLRYHSANGTDFVVGMTKGHIWEGGAGRTQDGTVFFPNMPTEEVFTSPDRMRRRARPCCAALSNPMRIRAAWVNAHSSQRTRRFARPVCSFTTLSTTRMLVVTWHWGRDSPSASKVASR